MNIYESIFRRSLDGIFTMSKDRIIISCNNALCKIFGYKEHELVGKSASIFHPSKESYEAYGKEMALAKDEGGSFLIEWDVVRKDKALFPTEVALSPIVNDDGSVEQYMLIIRDISRRKEIEIALQESEKKYRELSESLPLAIFETDRLGNISYVNESGLLTFGYDKEDVLVNGNFSGMNVLQVIAPQDREAAIDNVQLVLSGEKIDTEYTCVKKNGTEFPAIVNATPIFLNGKIIGIRGILLDITERKMTEEKIRHLALHDPLTGLPNRILLTDRFTMALELAKRYEKKIGCLMLDLDDFKRINDSFGHLTGDLLLREVSDRIHRCIRKVDTLARIGGDEFAIILPEIDNICEAETIAKRILESTNSPFNINGEEIFVKVSIGISMCPENGSELISLQQKADTAMYKAKEGGKNALCIAA